MSDQDAEKTLHIAWAAMHEAMLQTMTGIHAGEDEDGTLQVIADNLDQGLEAIRKAESALGLSFIPENTSNASAEPPKANSGDIPF